MFKRNRQPATVEILAPITETDCRECLAPAGQPHEWGCPHVPASLFIDAMNRNFRRPALDA